MFLSIRVIARSLKALPSTVREIAIHAPSWRNPKSGPQWRGVFRPTPIRASARSRCRRSRRATSWRCWSPSGTGPVALREVPMAVITYRGVGDHVHWIAQLTRKCDRGTFCSARWRRSCWTASARRHPGSGCFPAGAGTNRWASTSSTGSGSRRVMRSVVPDARLHALHHANAQHAAMNGESLYVAGRLLGHRRASATNRNARLDDATLSQAAERVAVTVRAKLCQHREMVDQFSVPTRRGRFCHVA